MNITLGLSTESIEAAIRELENLKDELDYSMSQTLAVLAKDGANVAQEAFGSMATVTDEIVNDSETKIVAHGHGINHAGDHVIIAEFGAGYGTMEDHPFADKAPVPIKVASYSQAQYPYGLFYITNDLMPGEGYWFFGGKEYSEVPAKHGLLNAYDYLKENSTRIAKEVIKFD